MLNMAIVKVAKSVGVSINGRKFNRLNVLCENEEGKVLFTMLFSMSLIMRLMEEGVTDLDDMSQICEGLKKLNEKELLQPDEQYEHSLILVEEEEK